MSNEEKLTNSVNKQNDKTKVESVNDSSNETRALLLLAQVGLITIKQGKNIETGVSKLDIEDSKGLNIVELDAELVPTTLKSSSDGSLAVINGNYALENNIGIMCWAYTQDTYDDFVNSIFDVIEKYKESEE